MRHWFIAILSTAVVTGACQPASTELTDAQREAIAAEVNQTVAGLIEAMSAHAGDRVLGHYMNSDAFAYVSIVDAMVGWDGFAQTVGPWYDANPDVTFEYEILHTQVLSLDVATVVFRGSSTEAEALMWTQVLVRSEDGSWMIILEHESWPQCVEPPTPHPITGRP